MEKKLDIVFFCNLANIYWNEDINLKLSKILENLNVNIAKTLGYEVELSLNGTQTIKTIERPAFSNEDQKISITFIDDRLDFKFILNEKEDMKTSILKYFQYLEDIVKEFQLKIIRVGINCEKNNDNVFNLEKYYLPLKKENIFEFGIKQGYQEEIIKGDSKILLNVLTVLEKGKGYNNFLLDFNTPVDENGIEKNLREIFLNKVGEEIDKVFNNLLITAKGE